MFVLLRVSWYIFMGRGIELVYSFEVYTGKETDPCSLVHTFDVHLAEEVRFVYSFRGTYGGRDSPRLLFLGVY